jgi:glycosyltransferase involved in cell wall biosynthesis
VKYLKRGEGLMKKKGSFRICVVTFPLPSALVVSVLLCNLVEILDPICEKIYVMTSNIPKDRTFSEKIIIKDIKTALHFRDTIQPMWWSTLWQFLKIIVIQLKMCWTMVKISKEIDAVIFYVAGANSFLPVLTAKILRKKVITSAIGLGSLSYRKTHNNKLFSMGGAFSTILNILERANFSLSDQIIVESASVVNFLGLDKYKQKLAISGVNIDTKFFKMKKELRGRKNLVGYVGRLSLEKGVTNFAKAMPIILKKSDNIEFLIGGGGTLESKIRDELKKNDLSQNVKQTGWIPHNEVVDYFNELKLFILPSYSEGLPHTALKAMACGTPVLATPVGGIPDVIKDGETGFIMEDNSPECIAENVIRALEHPNLDEIAKNARKMIEKEYTYEVVVENYRNLLIGKG